MTWSMNTGHCNTPLSQNGSVVVAQIQFQRNESISPKRSIALQKLLTT